MVISQHRSRLSPTGKRYKKHRGKRQFEAGNNPALTKIGERKAKSQRTIGGNSKQLLIQHNVANVLNPKSKKFSQSKIITVVESPANKNYVRRNIITKGSIIETEAGKARVTSRPGQEGAINAVLI